MANTKEMVTKKSLSFIEGKFEKRDAIDILTRLIHSKIKFHEDRISKMQSEEDIKMRENRIKLLQGELYQMKEFIDKNDGSILINSEIKLEISTS